MMEVTSFRLGADFEMTLRRRERQRVSATEGETMGGFGIVPERKAGAGFVGLSGGLQCRRDKAPESGRT